MGLLVDLTNTTRFYDRNEIEKEGVKYVKLQCKGYVCVTCFLKLKINCLYLHIQMPLVQNNDIIS